MSVRDIGDVAANIDGAEEDDWVDDVDAFKFDLDVDVDEEDELCGLVVVVDGWVSVPSSGGSESFDIHLESTELVLHIVVILV